MERNTAMGMDMAMERINKIIIYRIPKLEISTKNF